MSSSQSRGDLLRLLAAMPFLDRLELAAMSGWSRRSAYDGIAELGRRGLVDSVGHATPLLAPTRRFHLTDEGPRLLAGIDGVSQEEPLRSHPVSGHWQRLLLERLDALAAIYRLASSISIAAGSFRFRWYRSAPMDASILLPGGRTVAIVRQGLTSDRTAFAKRIWRLWEGPRPGLVLLTVPDVIRLRQARRLLASAPTAVFLALEEDAVLGLRPLLDLIRPGGRLPLEGTPVRTELAQDLNLGTSGDSTPGRNLPAVLKSTEKRTLDLLFDWLWLTPGGVAGSGAGPAIPVAAAIGGPGVGGGVCDGRPPTPGPG